MVLSRIGTINSILVNSFSRLLESTPRVNQIHEFYRAIINIYSNVDDFKRNLGRIRGALRVIENLSEEYRESIRFVKTTKYVDEREAKKHIARLWRQYLARLSSFLDEIRDAFLYLRDIVGRLRMLPDYNPELRTVVVCGPPNSGKSTLVGRLSNARVEVAEYPFTTKNLVFGHIKFDTLPPTIVQIVDTPGLFDRPISDRKAEEILALEAIRTIADCIVFLFDGSVERALGLRSQIRVYEDVVAFFGQKHRIIAINKVDIKDDELCRKIINFLNDRGERPLLISAKRGYGIDILLEEIKRVVTDGHNKA